MQQTVGTASVLLNVPMSGTPLIQNLGPGAVYVGDIGVTVANGFRLAVGGVLQLSQDLGLGSGAVHLIADAINTDVRYLVVG